ncbi:MAG TPA: hypothetical protein VNG53_01090 [Bacteroidia bacterium]|nr:hypothetical protein [Bacteroidia bacterium]
MGIEEIMGVVVLLGAILLIWVSTKSKGTTTVTTSNTTGNSSNGVGGLLSGLLGGLGIKL